MYMYSDAIEHCMDHSKRSDITESYVSPSIILPPCEQGHGIVLYMQVSLRTTSLCGYHVYVLHSPAEIHACTCTCTCTSPNVHVMGYTVVHVLWVN